jgi:hypothetical protein
VGVSASEEREAAVVEDIVQTRVEEGVAAEVGEGADGNANGEKQRGHVRTSLLAKLMLYLCSVQRKALYLNICISAR